MRRENEQEKKQNGYCEQDMVDQIARLSENTEVPDSLRPENIERLLKGKKQKKHFSFIPDRTCSSLCSSCNGNHSVAVWKPASWNDRL